MALLIRPMIIRDKPKVTGIIKATPEFTPEEVKVALELVDIYLKSTTVFDYHILIAEEDSSLCGYICYGMTPMTEGTWDIYWIAVDKDRKRRGIGRALLEGAEKKIRKARGRLILIETSSQESYESTRRFYFHQGYETLATIADFYTRGDDKLILGKRVSGDG